MLYGENGTLNVTNGGNEKADRILVPRPLYNVSQIAKFAQISSG